MFAILNINKPQGITSHDVVSRVRRVFGLKRVGHMGTLDPLATGVLPVALGQATRLIEYFPDDKRYTAEFTFGVTTTTLDSEGEILYERPCTELTPKRLLEVAQPYIGTFEQKVPLHSAVHVKGKKLYELARKGITDVELPSRSVTIHEINLLGLDNTETERPLAHLDIRCGSGTYIRSLGRDMGEALGCGAHMSGLIRTRHGLLTLESSVDLDALAESDNPRQYLLNPLDYLAMPLLALESEQDYRLISNGMKLDMAERTARLKPNALYLTTFTDEPVAVVRYEAKKLRPLKVFPPAEAAR